MIQRHTKIFFFKPIKSPFSKFGIYPRCLFLTSLKLSDDSSTYEMSHVFHKKKTEKISDAIDNRQIKFVKLFGKV